jgi:hypothetical protein
MAKDKSNGPIRRDIAIELGMLGLLEPWLPLPHPRLPTLMSTMAFVVRSTLVVLPINTTGHSSLAVTASAMRARILTPRATPQAIIIRHIYLLLNNLYTLPASELVETPKL